MTLVQLACLFAVILLTFIDLRAAERPALAPPRPRPSLERCPFCHVDVARGVAEDETLVRCVRCDARHHLDCWSEHGARCSVYGCGSFEGEPTGKPEAPAIADPQAALTAARERAEIGSAG